MYNIKKETRRILTLALTAIMILAMMPFMPGAAQQANADGPEENSPKVVKALALFSDETTEKVTVNLLANGVKAASVVLDGKTDDMKTDSSTGITCGETSGETLMRTATFSDLPPFDKDGHKIEYTISEEHSSSLKSEIDGPETYGAVAAYLIQYSPDTDAKISPAVRVVWDDGPAPEPIELKLQRSTGFDSWEDVPDQTVKLDGTPDGSGEDTAWHGHFKPAAKYTGSRSEQEYRVKPVTASTSWTATVRGTAKDGFTVTVHAKGTPAKASIHARVTLDGDAPGAGRKFSFTLYSGSDLIETVDSDPDGNIKFSAVDFDSEKIYHFNIRQKLPADATSDNGYMSGGIRYDDREFSVNIKVSRDGENLSIDEIMTHRGEMRTGEAVFSNETETWLDTDAAKIWVPFAPGGAEIYISLDRSKEGSTSIDRKFIMPLDGKVDKKKTSFDQGDGSKCEAWEDAPWHVTFRKLKRMEEPSHTLYDYTVRECDKAGNEITDTENNKITYWGGQPAGFIVTNTWKNTEPDPVPDPTPDPAPLKIYPAVEKVWDGISSDGKSVTLELQHNKGTAKAPDWEKISEITLDGTKDEGVTASGKEKGEFEAWHGRFGGIDSSKPVYPGGYRVVETTKGDFTCTVSGDVINGFKVTNSKEKAPSKDDEEKPDDDDPGRTGDDSRDPEKTDDKNDSGAGRTEHPYYSGSGKNAGVRTGDDSPLALSAAVFAIALAAVLALLRRRTNK